MVVSSETDLCQKYRPKFSRIISRTTERTVDLRSRIARAENRAQIAPPRREVFANKV